MNVIVETGGANLASLQYALGRLGSHAEISSDASVIAAGDRVLLPGVGSAGDAMQRLRERGLVDVLRSLTQPVLGICLGMQLLFEHSDEDDTECLGVLSGISAALPASTKCPVPHMGWNRIATLQDHPLFAGIDDGSHFYFVHSYAHTVRDHTIAACSYDRPFSAAVASGNFLGTQFHPERSAEAGSRVLQNFLELPACC